MYIYMCVCVFPKYLPDRVTKTCFWLYFWEYFWKLPKASGNAIIVYVRAPAPPKKKQKRFKPGCKLTLNFRF